MKVRINFTRLSTRLKALGMATLIAGCANPLGGFSKQTAAFHPGFLSTFKIETVAPSIGVFRGGTTITIQGSGFLPGATVSLGTKACLNVSYISDKKLTCVTPSHQAGAVAVTVANSDSRATTLNAGFEFLGSASGNERIGIASSGGIAAGPGVRLRFSLGGVGNPVQPAGTGVRARVGLQGALAQP